MDEIVKILEWIGSEKFKYDGYRMWHRNLAEPRIGHFPGMVKYTTEQLIDQYYRENGRKRTDSGESKTSVEGI